MSSEKNRNTSQRSPRDEFAHLGRAYLAAGMNLWDRSWEIGFRYLKQAIVAAPRSDDGALYVGRIFQALLAERHHYLAEMATVPALAAERLGVVINTPPRPKLLFRMGGKFSNYLNNKKEFPDELLRTFARNGVLFSGNPTFQATSGNHEWLITDERNKQEYVIKQQENQLEVYGQREGTLYRVRGKDLTLPLRIRDAAQGFALYAVSRRTAQSILDKKGTSFVTLDLGHDRTPLALFIVNYRISDLGAHKELGIAFFVAPRHDPSAIGMYIDALPVDQRPTPEADGFYALREPKEPPNKSFSCEAGKQIWGYPKSEEYLEFEYPTKDKVRCTFARKNDKNRVFTITLPRGGNGSSTAIPFLSYTWKDGALCQTVFTRSGRGERIRAGGAGVEFKLGKPEENENENLWKMLNALKVQEKSPILHAWTEHMSGEFSPPRVLEEP